MENLGDDTWRIAVAVRNDGYLPTNVTAQAVKMKVARPVEARLQLAPGAELLLGTTRQEIGHLDGYGGRRKVEWIVRFPDGPMGQIEIAGERSGTVRLDLEGAGV